MRGGAAITAAAALTTACSDAHHVEILLGPDEQTLSRGFTCFEEDTPLIPTFADFLPSRGTYVPDPTGPGGSLSFNVVVDFITLGDGVPACRGEEITAWCDGHPCRPVVVEPRFCRPVTITNIVPADLLGPGLADFRVRALDELYTQLRGYGDIIDDAPDESVIIRVVATDQPCDVLTTLTASGGYPAFETQLNSPSLIGCAYSCPVQLDTVEGTVELALDGNGSKCENDVRACAGNLAALE